MNTILLWAVTGILAFLILILILKIYLLQKAAEEIRQGFAERLNKDTNTLIDISSRDRHMRALAADMNVQLRRLRTQRLRFQQGDMELKNAVTNISHDLRTPLTAMFGYLDLLEKEEKTKISKQYIDIIRNRAEMMTQLTEELFRYSVILAGEEALSPEPVVLGEVLEESIAAFYTVLKRRGIIPHIRIPDEKIWRTLDRSVLSRVFSNLLQNALKYSEGDLEISLSRTGEIVFSNRTNALNSVQAGRLFDRFYTVESGRGSTGLGLSIARTLVERMGGSINAEYREGRLYLSILFPAASRDQHPSASVKPREQSP